MPKPTGSGYSFKSNSGSRSTGPARNTSIPKSAPAAKRMVTHEAIAKRAYEIYASGRGGSAVDNWLRAEAELKSV